MCKGNLINVNQKQILLADPLQNWLHCHWQSMYLQQSLLAGVSHLHWLAMLCCQKYTYCVKQQLL